MGQLTTHILDTAVGRPAEGVKITAFRLDNNAGGRVMLAEARTNADGRCDAPLVAGADFIVAGYELEFHIGAWFRVMGAVVPDPPFLDIIPIRFAVADADAHYHVPLLVSPFGYGTYRGS